MPRFAIAVLTAALLAVVVAGTASSHPHDDPPPPWPDTHPTVILELRVWQHVDDAEEVWVSARPKGGRWDTLGTIPLPPWDGQAFSYGEMGRHRFGDIAVGGVEVRVWQRWHRPARIYVQACASACPEPVLARAWRPLGKIPLPLDAGHTASGRYRYGDLDLAVPSDNPGLQADRDHLLALRDVLQEGTGELDWDAGRPTADWEGITLGGTPPRVTELDLAWRGLGGEIWGWLGDLSALTSLQLAGNALTGTLPSKLQLLRNLTYVSLYGNALEGCIPPGLWRVTNNDLWSVELPRCGTPAWLPGGSQPPVASARTYRMAFDLYTETFDIFVFDVPAWRAVRFEARIGLPIMHYRGTDILESGEWGLALRLGAGDGTWIFLSHETVHEIERSHYSGCIYDCGRWKSPAALVEQLAASLWVNPAIISDYAEWVWP